MTIRYTKLENGLSVFFEVGHKIGGFVSTQWGYRKIVAIYSETINASLDMPYGC